MPFKSKRPQHNKNKTRRNHSPNQSNQEHQPANLSNIFHPDVLQSPSPDTVLQLQRTIGNQATMRLLKSQKQAPSSQPQTKIQRMNLGESYYYNSMNYYIEPNVKPSPAFRNFTKRLYTYEQFANNRISTQNLETLQDYLDKVYDAALVFQDFMRNEIIPKVENSERLGRNKKAYVLRTAETMARNAVDDAQQEQQALQFLVSDPNFADSDSSWSKALFLARMGESATTILGEDSLAPGTGDNAAGNPEKLSGGQVSDVTALDFNTEDGGSKRRVFKPNESTAKDAPDDQIKHGTYSTIRVMAASRVDQLIKSQMLKAGHQFESMIGNFDIAEYDGNLGFAADFAPGQDVNRNKFVEGKDLPVSTTHMNVDVNDIALQQQMANLQLYDFITGQVDRHMGNVRLQQQEGEDTKVTGIDNDFAFSLDTDITKTLGKTAYPQLIDMYFADAIIGLDMNIFEAALKGLMPGEIEAAKTRFASIQNDLQNKKDNNELIVAPADKQQYPEARSWADIDSSEYRYSSFGTKPTDYMGDLVHTRESAINAIKKDPESTKPYPKLVKDKLVYVIEYTHDESKHFMQAREEDGSDLWDLYEEAMAQKGIEEATELFGNQHQQRNQKRRRRRRNIVIGGNRG